QDGSNSAQQPDAKHAIVTLGYKLNVDGSIAPPLELRLEKTIEIATLNPDSIIIVTGGVETAGITEAEQMERWLLKRGINGRRIIKEDKAINTIENAKRSLGILQAQEIRKATLVSASIHVHRSQVLFETMQFQNKSNYHNNSNNSFEVISFDHIAVKDGLSPENFPTGQTRINCYIDAIRGYGLPAFMCGKHIQM
ncbi:YdcF family protein, partial [Photobacterium sp. BZF1]|uniref:YdcF family protein n=1 Tax=Photobacterium sp. BZF1 TaxID=1904457 RepID=UPI001653D592